MTTWHPQIEPPVNSTPYKYWSGIRQIIQSSGLVSPKVSMRPPSPWAPPAQPPLSGSVVLSTRDLTD